MITADLIILGLLVYSIALICIGYFLREKPKAQEESDYILAYPPTADPKNPGMPIMVRKPGKPKPGGIFKGQEYEYVPSGPVQRPSAAQISEWNKNPIKKAEEEEMRRTFESNPDLVQSRQIRQFIKSSHGK